MDSAICSKPAGDLAGQLRYVLGVNCSFSSSATIKSLHSTQMDEAGRYCFPRQRVLQFSTSESYVELIEEVPILQHRPKTSFATKRRLMWRGARTDEQRVVFVHRLFKPIASIQELHHDQQDLALNCLIDVRQCKMNHLRIYCGAIYSRADRFSSSMMRSLASLVQPARAYAALSAETSGG